MTKLRRARRTTANRSGGKEVRDWARNRGLDVSDRGRIPADIMAKYEAEIGA